VLAKTVRQSASALYEHYKISESVAADDEAADAPKKEGA
jgi:hypothetical protein